MYNHVPKEYKCPLCIAIGGIENADTQIKQADIFYQDEFTIGFIGAKFIPGSEGHPLVAVVPHFEHIYDLHGEAAHRVMDLTRRVAIALKQVRHCDGVKIIQNNEPAAGQHAFHFHLHIIPRFIGDVYDTQRMNTRMSTSAERVSYARKLREYFAQK